jgi:hypothetical protein
LSGADIYILRSEYIFSIHISKEGFMKNCEMKITGSILTITVDLAKDFGKSASGKSIIIASTEGNVSVPEKEDVKIGLNIYKKV